MTVMRYSVCFLILALFLLGAVSCGNDQRVVTRQEFIALQDFSVTSESTGLATYTKGIIYVRENKGYHAEILAWYRVDPADFWGGVMFGIPCGWEVTGVTSNPSNLYNVNAVSVQTMAPGNNSQLNQWVWVEGYGRGGSGTLVIELDSTSCEQNPEPGVLKIGIGVGSDERDGVRIIFPDSKDIEVPLN
jgi:hypothetical protein